MLYPDAQPQDKSSGRGTPAKPKKRPHANPHAAVPADFLTPAPPAQPKTPSYDPLSSIRPPRPKLTPRPATQPKTPSYDPLSSIQAPQSKAAPALVAPDRGKPKKKKPAQVTDENASSLSGFPQDIEWQPDIDPADIFDLCGRLCEQNPQTMTSIMNFIEGFDPDDDEQTIRRRVNNHLQIIGLNDAFDRGDWYTTPIDPSLSHSAAQIADYYFDRRRTSQEERTAAPTAEEALLPDQDQILAKAVGFTAPEINYPTQYLLTETFPEWNPSWTKAEDFQKFLIPRQERFIDEFNATAVNWDDLTVQDTLMKYRLALIDGLNKIWVEDQQITSRYEEIEAELGIVNELLLMAQPIPLDDTTAYIEAFTGTVWIPDAEHERKHVQDQLALIYEDILDVEPQHLETQSTVELKYELYYRLRHDVLPFLNLDENESQIPDFMRDYVEIARDVPERVVSRLQGRDHRPDVAGFLFLLGLTMAFEPADWALTIPEVIEAASRGDWGAALLDTGLMLLPGVSGYTDNILRMTDEVAGATQLSRRSAGGYQNPASVYYMAHDDYISRTVAGYNSKNAGSLKKEMGRAAAVDSSFQWRLKDPNTKQQAHHIVPTGRKEGDQARDILAERGIYVNSAYNGIALEIPVHQLTNSSGYTKAINTVIVRLRNTSSEDIVMFLEETAKRLQALNIYPRGELLQNKFQTEIMDWLENYRK